MKFEKIKDELSIILFTIMTIIALLMLCSERSTTDFSEYAWFVCSIATAWAVSALWFAYRFGKSYQNNSLAEDNQEQQEPFFEHIELEPSDTYYFNFLVTKYSPSREDIEKQK